MRTVELIQRKRDGGALAEADIRALIAGYTDGSVPDYQMAAMAMAVFFRGLDGAETAAWTDAMLRSGRVLDLGAIARPKVDKHSTGGVGDKVSICLAPLAAACGVAVPMVSGRGLGHTGGTLDKLEAIPGFRTDLDTARFVDTVDRCGLALIGQTADIAPADGRLYALRDVTATVESIPLIAASIMSKKLAEGIDGLVLDVKVGSGAFMKVRERARTLAETMIDIGRRAGKRVAALLTDMDRPLGVEVGNAGETAEAIEVLHGGGPRDLVALTVELTAAMLQLAGAAKTRDDAFARVRAAIADGSGLARLRACVEAQGGDPAVCDTPRTILPRAPQRAAFVAPRAGFVTSMDCEAVGRAGMRLGAGRARKEDVVDAGVGLRILRKTGDRVDAGEVLCEIDWRDEERLAAARETLAEAWHIGEEPPAPVPLVLESLGDV
ncbi:MAG TPA: thymidine phosphorylase [Myxococcota bacterium]|jgi:pyrimidine-nucleoside phosphorylase|nr:thymidine phosphorylase [Myxococcota bacterium]